jgi:hypothetical protein
MVEQIHVLATFESREALLTAMAGAVSWSEITEAEAHQVLTAEPPDPYADKALRPGLKSANDQGGEHV